VQLAVRVGLEKPENNRKIIKNDPTESIFDMIAILAEAEEIHCMESSIRCFIDNLPEVNCPLYMHVGFRPDGHGESIRAGSRRNWTIVQHRR